MLVVWLGFVCLVGLWFALVGCLLVWYGLFGLAWLGLFICLFD
jgi:hypothetical protein